MQSTIEFESTITTERAQGLCDGRYTQYTNCNRHVALHPLCALVLLVSRPCWYDMHKALFWWEKKTFFWSMCVWTFLFVYIGCDVFAHTLLPHRSHNGAITHVECWPYILYFYHKKTDSCQVRPWSLACGEHMYWCLCVCVFGECVCVCVCVCVCEQN